MENISFTKILKDALVGKKLKVKTSSVNLIQEYSVWKKKSANVTNGQFESGDKKYRMQVNRTKVIGNHDKYETFTISSVYINATSDWEGGSDLHLVCKEGGREFTLEFTDELEAIGNDTYMIKQI